MRDLLIAPTLPPALREGARELCQAMLTATLTAVPGGCIRRLFPAPANPTAMLVDSHHHLWKYSPQQYGWIGEEMSILRQDFLLEDLRFVAAETGVDAFVTVQARQTVEETEWLLELAQQEPLIGGVVGWAPLADPDLPEQLALLAENRWLKGIRHVVQDEPDNRFLLGEAFNRGVAALRDSGLVYEILIYARQLPTAIEFVDAHPNQEFVLDHIAKPVISESAFDDQWERDVSELARREHVSCKFSGVVTEVRDEWWNNDTIRRYWDVALEAFSTKRLMFGSDWPVCLLRTGYPRWLETVRTFAGELSTAEQADFFGGNASRIYSLS